MERLALGEPPTARAHRAGVLDDVVAAEDTAGPGHAVGPLDVLDLDGAGAALSDPEGGEARAVVASAGPGEHRLFGHRGERGVFEDEDDGVGDAAHGAVPRGAMARRSVFPCPAGCGTRDFKIL